MKAAARPIGLAVVLLVQSSVLLGAEEETTDAGTLTLSPPTVAASGWKLDDASHRPFLVIGADSRPRISLVPFDSEDPFPILLRVGGRAVKSGDSRTLGYFSEDYHFSSATRIESQAVYGINRYGGSSEVPQMGIHGMSQCDAGDGGLLAQCQGVQAYASASDWYDGDGDFGRITSNFGVLGIATTAPDGGKTTGRIGQQTGVRAQASIRSAVWVRNMFSVHGIAPANRIHEGKHDGESDAAMLKDRNPANGRFDPEELVGLVVHNTTDASRCTITEATASDLGGTVSCTLDAADGTCDAEDCDWDRGDAYIIRAGTVATAAAGRFDQPFDGSGANPPAARNSYALMLRAPQASHDIKLSFWDSAGSEVSHINWDASDPASEGTLDVGSRLKVNDRLTVRSAGETLRVVGTSGEPRILFNDGTDPVVPLNGDLFQMRGIAAAAPDGPGLRITATEGGSGDDWLTIKNQGGAPGNTRIERGLSISRQAVDISTTASASKVYVGVTDTSVSRTVFLPTAACDDAGDEGRIYIVKDEGGRAGTNPVSVATEGAELIDGVDDQTIDGNYGSLILICGRPTAEPAGLWYLIGGSKSGVF